MAEKSSRLAKKIIYASLLLVFSALKRLVPAALSTPEPYDITLKGRNAMGMFRDPDTPEIDIIKEMAEALGSAGIRLEEILEQVEEARSTVEDLYRSYHSGRDNGDRPDAGTINDAISSYNRLVGKAEDLRRSLLIQREACGFRIHREVDVHYPVPAKMKFLKS
jgi:hypothetical protein